MTPDDLEAARAADVADALDDWLAHDHIGGLNDLMLCRNCYPRREIAAPPTNDLEHTWADGCLLAGTRGDIVQRLAHYIVWGD